MRLIFYSSIIFAIRWITAKGSFGSCSFNASFVEERPLCIASFTCLGTNSDNQGITIPGMVPSEVPTTGGYFVHHEACVKNAADFDNNTKYFIEMMAGSGRFGLTGRAGRFIGQSSYISMFCFLPASSPVSMVAMSSAKLELEQTFDFEKVGPPNGTHEVTMNSCRRTRLIVLDLDEEGADLERISITAETVPNPGISSQATAESIERNFETAIDQGIDLVLLSEESPCIKKYSEAGECVFLGAVMQCSQVYDVGFGFPGHKMRKEGSMQLSFHKKATVTLSRATRPQISSGRWFLILHCHRNSCQEELKVTVHHKSESHLYSKVVWGAAQMFFGTLFVMWAIDKIYLIFHRIYEKFHDVEELKCLPVHVGSTFKCNAAFFKFLTHQVYNWLIHPPPFFTIIFVLLMGIFVATAGQFVTSNWMKMVRTGDRNVCYYNTECFYTLGGDIPVNHMLSHIPYFLAGLKIIYQTFFTQWRLLELIPLEERNHPAVCDLRGFLALGVTFIAEGLGSAAYHVCPSPQTFQFDTCFMIPIAHMSCVALAEWPFDEESREGEKSPFGEASKGTSRVFRYFLFVLTPIWIFNFVGTWFDVQTEKLAGDMFRFYVCFCAALVVWSICIMRSFKHLLKVTTPETKHKGYYLSPCLSVILVGVAVAACFPAFRKDALGGLSNAFLLTSCLLMVLIVGWQVSVYSKELFHGIEDMHHGYRCIKAFVFFCAQMSYLPFLFVMTFFALDCFADKVVKVDIGAAASQSLNVNKPCLWGSIFDKHDLWHTLSAICLSLFAMFLLDLKVTHCVVTHWKAKGVNFSDDDDEESLEVEITSQYSSEE